MTEETENTNTKTTAFDVMCLIDQLTSLLKENVDRTTLGPEQVNVVVNTRNTLLQKLQEKVETL